MNPHAWALTFGSITILAAVVIAVWCLCVWAHEELAS